MGRLPQVMVIGAGVGGLTTAALLTQAGYPVTVLEAQSYPGGSAGTFFHKGYRFDAGATLAGGFALGGPHARLGELLKLDWPISPVDPAWMVYLGDRKIIQWTDVERWKDERQEQLPGSEVFWAAQERLAAISWRISSGRFPWPPVRLTDWWDLSRSLQLWAMPAVPYLLAPVSSLFPKNPPPELKTFVDAQLIISAQTTSEYAAALYGAAALDLPRRGVSHVRGGMGGIAQTLANWLKANGSQVLFRQTVAQMITRKGRAVAIRTAKGLEIEADYVVANLTPWGLAEILGEASPKDLQREIRTRKPGWGAFMLYLGLREDALSMEAASHYQVVRDPFQPLGEGNSVFISISDRKDSSRAPDGYRAATLSTHTAVGEWWRLAESDPAAYTARKEEYADKVLQTAEIALPGIRQAVELVLPATPVTFQRFTNRPYGMVGGFPQTSILTARGPKTGLPNLWLVGDSVFPGQSTAGVTLGAMRVAADVLREIHQGRHG